MGDNTDNPSWVNVDGGEKKVEVSSVGDLSQKIMTLKKLLSAEMDRINCQISAANEALMRAKNGGGR